MVDAVDRETVLGFVEFPGAVQQRLGRNATNVRTTENLSAIADSFGNSSQNCTPGRLVLMG